MKLNKLKAIIAVNLLSLSVILTGCSAAETESKETDAAYTVSTIKNSGQNTKAEKADIEALVEESVYNVYWYTQEGNTFSGTSFLMDSEVHGEKLLVSAFHCLWPDAADTFKGNELPEYVFGGELYNTRTSEKTDATLKNCLIIEDADVAPVVDKDVCAFTIQGGNNLKTLPLSTREVEKGDTVYLLADLWDTDDIHENCVYEAKVIREKAGVLYYELDEKYGTTGASGAPIVNEYGEVVAIHIGSNGSTRCGHAVESFMEQINQGTISDITYPTDMSAYESESLETEEDIDIYTFSREESITTTFFELQIDAVTLTDSLQEQAAPEGYQYVVLDISMNALDSDPVDMYYSDFALTWGEDYMYPLEAGWTEKQLPDEYVITGKTTSGQLVFYAPADSTEFGFSYLDYYYDDSDQVYYNGFYDIIIPAENWVR